MTAILEHPPPSGAADSPEEAAPGRRERSRFATFVRRSHVWLGLFTAVAMIVISTTGILLNHREQLGLGRQGPPLVEGSGDLDEALPINDLLKAALAASYDAGARITTRTERILPATGPGDIDRAMFRPGTSTVQVRMRDRRHTEVILDWSTAAVLDVAPRDDVTLEALHSGEILGQRGVIVSDIAAVVLILLLVGGIVIWVRRSRHASAADRRTGSSWVRWNWRFHLVAGLAVGAYLVVLSVTGIILNHKREWGFMREPVQLLEDEAVAKRHPAPLADVVDWALMARSDEGSFTVDDVRFVDYRPLSGYAKVRFKDGETEVVVDVYENEVLAVSHRRDLWLEDLHTGVRFGQHGWALSDLTALVVILLSANGIYLWIRPGWRTRTRAPAAQREGALR